MDLLLMLVKSAIDSKLRNLKYINTKLVCVLNIIKLTTPQNASVFHIC